jgi:predicted unusual protein kinase regulating ubiquinone biosynthesis (AarF/ABC1/UbiB family)
VASIDKEKEISNDALILKSGNGNNQENGSHLVVRPRVAPTNGNSSHSTGNGKNHPAALPLAAAAANTLAETLEKTDARGVRGLVRTVQIVRVLGSLGLFLFLDNYDVRRKFNRRMWTRLREEARARGRAAQFQEWSRRVDRLLLDRLILIVRFILFRSSTVDSSRRETRFRIQAARFKRNLIRLGPTFIKIGQTLGTRADLLPLPYIKELETLQDQVPAFPTSEAYARIETELNRPLREAFSEIDAEPIAAASLGQVYRARLHTGEEVAVKVQRPDLEEKIAFDIAVLRRITNFLSRYPAVNENADWEGMLGEFTNTISEEINYTLEAENADRFRRNFETWRAVHVPHIHWSHTTRRVLTMEFIRGTKVIDLENLRARRISPVKVNRLLIRTYLKQLLEDGFFHADPHPGNLLVMDDGRLTFFDFGMTGRITPELQARMIDAFFHVVERDVAGLAQDLINLNFLKPGVDTEKVRPVVESLFEHYINLKLGEVNFKELTYDLAEVMYDYPFRLPARFTYIIRALMTLEGIGIVTDPGFSFFDTAKPYAKDFMLRREGKQFRKLLVDKFRGRDESGKIEWGKMWKLAKMAAKMYLEK